MIRTVQTEIITETIKKMCIEANYSLSSDMVKAMRKAEEKEESVLGKQILAQLQDNLEIAASDMIPICQDTGMAVVFLEVGQDVHFEGGSFEDAVNEGVRRGYTEGFLRKSVVGDPILRENTKDNTPAVIHTRIVEGDRVKITVAPKGFGSENMSRVFMLKPAEGLEGVKNAILTAVKDAGPNACPPLVVGVGIGGTFEKCALMAKKALTREVGKHSDIPYVRKLEEEMLEKINCLGIGQGRIGWHGDGFGSKCQHISDSYCGTSGCGEYMLPCEQAYSLCFVKTADKIAAVEKGRSERKQKWIDIFQRLSAERRQKN